jgi:ElaB/YqjD/DUF883 family membrane-anchored ribosome-binding protein
MKGRLMDVINEPTRIQRNGKANRATAERSTNGRMGKRARKVTQDIEEMAGAVRDIAQEKLGYVRESDADHKGQAREKVQQVERTIEEFIRERPLKTVLIAAGVGLLLGRFWMRR